MDEASRSASSALSWPGMRGYIPARMRPLYRVLGTWVGAWFILCARPLSAAESDEVESGEQTRVPVRPVEAVAVEEEQTDRVRRGFHVSGDFGGYFSFGGRNTNDPGLPGRTASNFQPMVAVTAGYDVVTTDRVHLAAGVRLASAFNAGSGRVSDAEAANGDVAELSRRPADFSLLHAGAAAKLGFRLAERLSLNGLTELGVAIVEPDPAEPVTGPDGARTAVGFSFGVGAGLELATRLPGVSVGVDLRFIGTAVSSNFIPGMSITAPVKYNF